MRPQQPVRDRNTSLWQSAVRETFRRRNEPADTQARIEHGVSLQALSSINNRDINELAEAGRGVVVISSEMAELIGICDCIYVMNDGAFVGEFAGHDASQEKIMRAIMRNDRLRSRVKGSERRVGEMQA